MLRLRFIVNFDFMIILENHPLRTFNTFGIEAYARYFAEPTSEEEMSMLLSDSRFSKYPKLILGGGSNLLFTHSALDCLVLKNNVRGIALVREDEDHVFIRAGAGENWHNLVMYCIANGYGGVENLSLIPGNVGAGPMQNIGAYGVELKDVFSELEALSIRERRIEKFSATQCQFGYRESVFKRQLKDQYIITSVTLRLNKKPVFNVSYGAIAQELELLGVKELSVAAISQAVCNIRRSKLPDPAVIGNAGSFFKNPEVTSGKFKSLQTDFPGIIGYPLTNGNVKLAAGWLIEQCGWKGKSFGDAGVHKLQALVLVNYGKATGKEIYDLSQRVLDSVYKTFGVVLEREVNIL
jgi:UDP-N-acetylmuramate dehydrogenase